MSWLASSNASTVAEKPNLPSALAACKLAFFTGELYASLALNPV